MLFNILSINHSNNVYIAETYKQIMQKDCVNLGISINNDRIERAIENVTNKSAFKKDIISTFFNENKNINFRNYLLTNLSENEKTKLNINNTSDLINENISKININTLSSLIKKYYNNIVKDVDNYDSKEANDALLGFTSFSARYRAKIYTANKILETYWDTINSGNPIKNIKEEISKSIGNEFITYYLNPLVQDLLLNTDNKFIKPEHLHLCKNIEEITSNIINNNKEIKKLRDYIIKNQKSKDESIKNNLKEYKSKLIELNNNNLNLRQQRLNTSELLIKSLPNSYNTYKNYLALYSNILTNSSKWFDEVFRLKRLVGLDNIYDTLTEEQKQYLQYVEDEDSFKQYENDDSIDLTAKTWSDNLLDSFDKDISADVKLYFSSLSLLNSPVLDGNEDYDYATDPDLGVKINTTSEYVIQQIANVASFYSVDSFINSLQQASRNIKDLYFLGKVVNDIKKYPVLANRLYHELNTYKCTKFQARVNGTDVNISNSNENSKVSSSLLYSMVNSAIGTYTYSYKQEDADKITSYLNKIEDNFNNKNKRKDVINTVSLILNKYFIDIPISSFEDYFTRKTITLNEFKNFVSWTSDFLKDIARIKNNYITISDEYNKEKYEYEKGLKKIEDEAFFLNTQPDYSKLPEKPIKDYSAIGYNSLYFGSLINIAEELSKVIVVDTKLNSYNAENNMSTDMIPNSKLSDIMKQIEYTEIDSEGNVTQKGLEQLKDYVLKCEQYRFSNLFFGNGKTKGMFTRTSENTAIINPEAKHLIKVALFDGISNRGNNNGAMYEKLSKGDYFRTIIESFNNPINFYDGSFNRKSNIRRANYFMRTPSDAPKNFSIQTVAYNLRDMLKLDGTINKSSDMYLALKNMIYGELHDLIRAIDLISVNGIIENKIENKYFNNYHYKKNNIFTKDNNDNLILSGNVFHFSTLPNTTNVNVDEMFSSLISLYGRDNTSLLIRKNDHIEVNLDLFNILKSSYNYSGYDTQIDELLDKWIKDFNIDCAIRANEYKNILGNNITTNDVIEAAFNYVIVYNKFDDLFEGNAKFYKDPRTFLKRAKEVQAGGKTYAGGNVADALSGPVIDKTSIFTDDKLKELTGDIQFRNGFKAITINNTIRPSDRADSIEKELYNIFIKQGLSEEEAKNKSNFIAKGYKANTTTNDAQSYITFEEFIRRKYADGTLNNYKKLIEQIYSLEQLPDGNYDINKLDLSDIKARVQVQKNFYYDLALDEETGLSHPRQIKNAEFVLIPQLLPANSGLRKLYDMMKKYNIDQVNTAETSKAAQKNILTYFENDYDNDGNVKINPNFENEISNPNVINQYYYRYLYKQQDVPSHLVDKQNKAGIQIMKKILDNANMNNPIIKESVDKYFEAYSANIRMDFLKFIDKMGWKYDEKTDSLVNKKGNKKELKFDEFYKTGRLEAQRLGLDSNFIDYLTPSLNGKPIMPTYMNNVSTKLESIAQSMFNNNITRQKLPGWHAAQITNVGYSEKLKYHPEIKDENGNVIQESYAEILIPRWSNLIPKDYDIKKLEEEGLDIQIGYRIPTEGKQSISKLKVVGFLPDVYDSTVMVPDEWVTQTGSDFDVDSVYGIVYPMYKSYDKDGSIRLKKVEPNLKDDAVSTRERYINYVKNYLKENNLLDDYNKLINATKDQFESVNDTLNKIVSQNGIMKFNEFTNLSIIEQNIKDQRNVIILDSMINILNQEDSREENYSRSNFEEIEKWIEKYDKIRANANKVYNTEGKLIEQSVSIYNVFDQVDFMENAMSGAILKAFSVTRDTFNSIANIGKPLLDYYDRIKISYPVERYDEQTLKNRFGKSNVERKTIDGKEVFEVTHDKFAWSNDNKNIDGHFITTNSSQTTAHILDAIKSGSIYNENDYTFGVFKTLLDIGSNYETAIAFLMQPGITEINKSYYESKSIYINSYANPINNAYKNIAKRLGLQVKNAKGELENINEYTPFSVIKELLENYKIKYGDNPNTNRYFYDNNFKLDKEKELGIKDILTIVYNNPIESIFDNNFIIDLNLLKERLQNLENSIDLTDIAIDIATINIFKNLKETTEKIENVIRKCNPDRFGATQTLRDTREKVADIVKYSKFYFKEDKETEEVKIVIPNSVGRVLTINGLPFLHELYKDDSFYPYINEFYKDVTKQSEEINSNLFELESGRYSVLFDRITDILGKKLSDVDYKKFKQYLVTSNYSVIDILNKPITINSKGFICIDEDRINLYSANDDGYDISLKEKNRVFGYNVEQSENFVLDDFNSPNSEEISKFNKLTPAQKVLWIKRNFEHNSGIFNLLNITTFNEYEYNTKGYSTNRITYNDNGKDIDELIFQYDTKFNSKHPFIKLAAIDLIKYAFLVEGFNFKSGNIARIVSNKSLLNFEYEENNNVIDKLNQAITDYSKFKDIDPERREILLNEFDSKFYNILNNFIRANSELIPNITLRGNANNNPEHRAFLTSHITDNLYSLPLVKGNEAVKNLLHYISKDGETFPKYIRITRKINNNDNSTLFKITIKNESVFLYPLNLLEKNESSDISANIHNNKYRPESYYDSLIELSGQYSLNLNEVQKNTELKNKIDELRETHKITNITYNRITSTLENPDKFIEMSQDPNNKNLRNEVNVFFDNINDALEKSITPITLVNFVGYKVAELFNIEGEDLNISYIQNILTKNGDKFPIKISKYKLSSQAFRYLKGDDRIDINNLSIEERNVLGQIIRGKDAYPRIYKIERFKDQELIDFVNKAIENKQDVANNEKYSTTSLLGRYNFKVEESYEYPKLTKVTKRVIDDILYKKRLHVLDERDLFKETLQKLDVDTRSLSSIHDASRPIYKAIVEYYKALVDKISKDINEFVASDGNVYKIGSDELYEYLTENNEDYDRVVSVLLEARTIGQNISDIFDIELTYDDPVLQGYLNDIKKSISSIKNNIEIKKGFDKIFNIYFAKRYSNNPNVIDGLVNITTTFGDTSKADLLLSDIEELNHKQVQVVAKMVYSLLSESENIIAPKAVDKFNSEYENIMKEPGDINFDNIIDKEGKFITNYIKEFIEDGNKFINELRQYKIDYGTHDIRYLRKKLEYDKWKLNNIHQKYIDDYYKELIDMQDELYNKAGELYSEYLKLKSQLKDNTLVLIDDNLEVNRQLEIKTKIKALLSTTGKSDKQKTAIRTLKNYFAKKSIHSKKYFKEEVKNSFYQQAIKYQDYIRKYELDNPKETLDERLINDKYAEAYHWLALNGEYRFTPEANQEILNAFETLKNTNNSEDRVFKRLTTEKPRTDAFGIVNGNLFTDEEKLALRGEALKSYNNEFNTTSDATLIKDVQIDEPIYNSDYYDLFYSEISDEDNKKKKELNAKINEIIIKGFDDTGHLSTKLLFENCSKEELQDLANYYKELRTIKSGMNKDDMSYINQNVNFETNTAAYDKEYNYYLTNIRNNKDLNSIWQQIFMEFEFDNVGQYVQKLDKEGLTITPNRYIYGYIVPKENKAELFIDKEKTEAKRLIDNEIEFAKTEYYFEARDKAIRENKYKEWFDLNHVYNPYSRVWVPLAIWTTMKPKPGGKYDTDFVYTPKQENIETTIKPEFKNENWNKYPKNYKGNPKYDNHTNLTSKEKQMLRLLQNTVNGYSLGYSSEKFINEGFVPRLYEKRIDKKFILDQSLGVFGLDFNISHQGDFYDKFDYANDHEIDFPMLSLLKGKGYKEELPLPKKISGESEEDYQNRIKSIKEKNEAIKKSNLEIDNALMSRDWKNVFNVFIKSATDYQTRDKLKNTLYLLMQSLKDNQAYKVSNFGRLQTDKHNTIESTEYEQTEQTNTYKLTENWARRIIFKQFKEKSPLRSVADVMQNMTSAKYMIFNITGGIANITTGLTNIMAERLAGDYFDNKTFIDAERRYLSKTINFISDMYSDTSNVYEVALSKFFDVVDFDAMLERNSSGNLADKIIRSRDLLYSFQAGGEHYMQNSVLFAMLKSTKLYTDEKGKTILCSWNDYVNNIEQDALISIIGEDTNLLKLFKIFRSEIKSDANKLKKYDNFDRNIYIDFAKTHLGKEKLDLFIKNKNKALKDAKIEFNKLPDVESQLEFKNGKVNIKENGLLTGELFGEFKRKTISVNKKIHGVYDKYGAARLEKKWYGSLIMQYHKHIYPGLMKRYRGLFNSSYYNEIRGSIEKGSYVSLARFLTTEFRNLEFKNEDGEKIGILKSLQNILHATLDTVINIQTNWALMPEWEKRNCYRVLGDLAGVSAAMLSAILLYSITDDDEIKESDFLSTIVYLIDRLNSESRMYTPTGFVAEAKTLYSSPIAALNTPEDILSALVITFRWLTDEDYDINYTTGQYVGENKIWVKLRRNIPLYRVYDRLNHMAQNNQYYRIGDNNTNIKIAKQISEFINPED